MTKNVSNHKNKISNSLVNPLDYDEKIDLIKSNQLNPEDFDLKIRDNRLHIVYLIITHRYCTENTLLRNISAFRLSNVNKYGSLSIDGKVINFHYIRKILLKHPKFTRKVLHALARMEGYKNHDLMSHEYADQLLVGKFAHSLIEISRIQFNNEPPLDLALTLLLRIDDRKSKISAYNAIRDGCIRGAFRKKSIIKGYTNLDKIVKDVFSESSSSEEQEIIVSLPDLEIEYIENLSKSQFSYIRACIAERKDLNLCIIKRLAGDFDRLVRLSIAMNVSIPLTNIYSYFDSEDLEILEALLGRHDIVQSEKENLRRKINLLKRSPQNRKKLDKELREIGMRRVLANIGKSKPEDKIFKINAIPYQYTKIVSESLEELDMRQRIHILMLVLSNWSLLKPKHVMDFLDNPPIGFTEDLKINSELRRKKMKFENFRGL